jgi:single-strand DNA-binding protein
MPNFNRVIVAGHLGADPETKGDGPTRFSIAVTDRWKDADDQKQERTNWFQVIAWNGIAESARMLHKGSAVLIEGSLRQNEWIDEDTQQKRSRVEIVAERIVFLSPKPAEQTTFPRDATPGAAPRKTDRKKP